jgi:F-type H+-transporting ATPase subunit c
MLGAGAVFAAEQEHDQAAADTSSDNTGILYIASAFGMALVSSFGAIAMGIAVKSFSEGVARNPSAADKLQFGLILTLVLIETLALYVLAVLFVKVV